MINYANYYRFNNLYLGLDADEEAIKITNVTNRNHFHNNKISLQKLC